MAGSSSSFTKHRSLISSTSAFVPARKGRNFGWNRSFCLFVVWDASTHVVVTHQNSYQNVSWWSHHVPYLARPAALPPSKNFIASKEKYFDLFYLRHLLVPSNSLALANKTGWRGGALHTRASFFSEGPLGGLGLGVEKSDAMRVVTPGMMSGCREHLRLSWLSLVSVWGSSFVGAWPFDLSCKIWTLILCNAMN